MERGVTTSVSSTSFHTCRQARTPGGSRQGCLHYGTRVRMPKSWRRRCPDLRRHSSPFTLHPSSGGPSPSSTAPAHPTAPAVAAAQDDKAGLNYPIDSAPSNEPDEESMRYNATGRVITTRGGSFALLHRSRPPNRPRGCGGLRLQSRAQPSLLSLPPLSSLFDQNSDRAGKKGLVPR